MLFIQNPNDFHTLNYRSCHWCWINLCSKHIVSEKITIYLAMFGGSISFVWTISALVSSTYTHTINAVSSVKMYFSLRWMFLVRVSYTTKTVYYSIHPISIDSNILFFLRSIGGMMGNTVVFTHRLSLSGGQLARLRECFRFSLFRYETAFESSNPVWECYTAYMKIWKQLLSIREYKPINCSRRV